MKISQLIKILENVKKEVGDLPIYLPDGSDEIGSFTFNYEFGKIAMLPVADDDMSNVSVIRKITREVVE